MSLTETDTTHCSDQQEMKRSHEVHGMDAVTERICNHHLLPTNH